MTGHQTGVAKDAKDYDCPIAEAYAAPDAHPVELDRDRYLRRT